MSGERRGSPYLDALIKDLEGWDYDVTSEPTDEYNCIAWAAGDESAWWDPFEDEGRYWPEGAPREQTLTAYVRAFEISGFTVCEDDSLNEGYEKLALYMDDRGNVHAARQLDALYWTSKLGRLHDIRHPLSALVESTVPFGYTCVRPKATE
jgi:hypothetical protein